MKHLLDVNILVAWGWSDHEDHDRVATWIGKQMQTKDAVLMTSPIPQLGFIRVSVQRTAGNVSVREASEVLSGMLESLGSCHHFLADNRAPAEGFADWCGSASRTTDAHLLALAEKHNARLATLDTKIPGAFVLP